MNWNDPSLPLPLSSSLASIVGAAAPTPLIATTTTTEILRAPEWMHQFVAFRKRLFLATVEPIVVTLLGPVVEEDHEGGGGHAGWPVTAAHPEQAAQEGTILCSGCDLAHRRLGFLPSYISQGPEQETYMSFATLIMLFVTLNCVFLIFLSCFYHNQKTSPLFISPRRHRLPKLVPPPLPVDGYFSWVRVCFYLSDEEIINRIGYDSLIFIRFHRLALRCIVKMSIFSFVVLLPLNFTGGGQSDSQDLKEIVFFTDFMMFTMANIVAGSPRLWVHCFAAYLLTGIVVRELLVEYETFNSIRHRYLLSREPHLRTVLVTNVPRHLRSSRKITSYFKHVYPNAVHTVFMCQNLVQLEALIASRTTILSKIEKELLVLCRTEKRKLYEQSWWLQFTAQLRRRCEDDPCCTCFEGPQERLATLYGQLEELNVSVEQEQHRRRRVMKMLDCMEAGEGAADIDYVLASPFIDGENAKQRRVLGLATAAAAAAASSSSTNASHHPPYPDDNGKAAVMASMYGGGHGRHNAQTYQPPTLQTAAAAAAVATTTSSSGVSSTQPPPHNFDHPHHSQRHRPESIPEGNEDDDETGVGGNGVPITRSSAESDDNGSLQSISQLRSRSPATPMAVETGDDRFSSGAATGPLPVLPNDDNDDDPEAVKENVSSRARRGLRSFVKAKQAIRRYGRFNQDVSFLGRPINRTSVDATDKLTQSHIEDHINEVTDKAFVVMRTFTAATIAIQSMHSSKPGSMQVSTAPEPRDILWKNIYVSKGAHRTRSYLGEILVLLIITFYVFPVLLVSLLVSDVALKSSSPRLAQLAQASSFFAAAIALVQPLCIVGLQQLLPPLFMLIGEAEGTLSFSEVQMRAFSRYFLFQVVNVFLVTTIAGSIFDAVAHIVESPESAFEMLGNSLPRLSSFFITFVTIKTFLALGFELVRTMSLVQATLRYFLLPNATLRTQRTITFGMRAIDDPGWFPFHKILAQDMLVVVVGVVFAVVAPLVLLPCAMFFLFSRIMWTHHHLYVYESVFESGGQFWPKIFRRFVFGLIIAQMTITGQFIVKEARHEAYATIALMFLTYFFLRSTRARYDPTSSSLPLEVATVMDISLHQEELEAQRRQQQQLQQQQQAAAAAAAAASTAPHKYPTSSSGVSGSAAEASVALDPGALIGRFDPFRKAYLQPALRANPRARPEQPFPAAQLGREPSVGGGGSSGSADCGGGGGGGTTANSDDSTSEDDWQDSGATVRLKSMNQQDRRLVNRWWHDQLQRAGDQNVLSVLIGLECGTLTLSHHSGGDVELHDQASFHQSLSMV